METDYKEVKTILFKNGKTLEVTQEQANYITRSINDILRDNFIKMADNKGVKLVVRISEIVCIS